MQFSPMNRQLTPATTAPRVVSFATPVSFSLITLVFLALSVLLPIGFHQVGLGGRIFLPMHIPALLAGFVAGPWSGLMVGLLGPGLSYLATGMPPTYAIPLMTLELALYGITAGVLYYRMNLNLYVSLIAAMIAGRIMFGIGLFLLGFVVELPYTASQWFSTAGAMVTGWPGLLVQLAIIPPIVLALRRASSSN